MDRKRVMAMWWSRRRPVPLWVWILAMMGFRSLWVRQARRFDPDFQEKRRRFREKMKDAFSVWKEPAEEDPVGSAEDPSNPS